MPKAEIAGSSFCSFWPVLLCGHPRFPPCQLPQGRRECRSCQSFPSSRAMEGQQSPAALPGSSLHILQEFPGILNSHSPSWGILTGAWAAKSSWSPVDGSHRSSSTLQFSEQVLLLSGGSGLALVNLAGSASLPGRELPFPDNTGAHQVLSSFSAFTQHQS